MWVRNQKRKASLPVFSGEASEAFEAPHVRKDPLNGSPVHRDHGDPHKESPEVGRLPPEAGLDHPMGNCTVSVTLATIRTRDGNITTTLHY